MDYDDRCDDTAYAIAKQVIGDVDYGRTEKEYLVEVRDYLEHIIGLMPGHVYWQDRNNVFLGCNELQARNAGLSSSKDIIGKSNHDMLWKEEADHLNRLNQQVITTGVPYVAEEVATMLNGTRTYLSNKIPLRNKKGEIVGILGVSLDITEIKNLQQELLESETREARFKTLSAVGGMIAHEMRTPLAGVKATAQHIHEYLPQLLEWYERGIVSGEIENPIRKDQFTLLKESLTDIDRSVNYMQSTINTILAGFQHMDAREKISTHPCVLVDVVHQAVQTYPMHAFQRELITVAAMDGLIFSGQEDILVSVLHNLLKNALQSIVAAGKGAITITAERHPYGIELSFCDTAQGVPVEHLPHIFEAFYTTKQRASQSVGLGLYFCKIALERVNATIVCESIWGEYAKFKITLPIDGDHN